MLKKWLLILLVAVTSGCVVPAEIRLPGNNFRSPETSGDFLSGSIESSFGGSAKVKVVDNINQASPQTAPDIGEDGAINFGLNLGLLPKLDLVYFTGSEFPHGAGIQLQIFGETRPNAKKGNIAVSLTYATIFGDIDAEDDDQEAGTSANAVSEYSGYFAAVSIGYRPNDRAMVYLSPFVYDLKGETTVKRTVGGSTSITTSPTHRGTMNGAALGVLIGNEKVFAKAEGSYATSKWERTAPAPVATDEQEESYFGIGGGLAW